MKTTAPVFIMRRYSSIRFLILSLAVVALGRISYGLSLLNGSRSSVPTPSIIRFRHLSDNSAHRINNLINIPYRRDSQVKMLAGDEETVSIYNTITVRHDQCLFTSIIPAICISLGGFLMSSHACMAYERIQGMPTYKTYPAHILIAQNDYIDVNNNPLDTMTRSISTSIIEWNKVKLSSPTVDRPQIRIDPSQRKTIISKENSPFVQGMIYILDHRDAIEESRRDSSQILLLTISTSSQPDRIIAGAKIPLIDISRFPIQVILNQGNILPTLSKDEKEDVTKRQDLKVIASICSIENEQQQERETSSVKMIPCQDTKDISFQAIGYSKILSGGSFGIGVDETIRAPFSLGLTSMLQK